ncbi:MAG: hypothetical protein IKA49_02580 [Alistipes sp.]|nr:hypothetical protein [Alistipes sp.]
MMKRTLLAILAVGAIISVTAQTPEAIREIIRKNPNFAEPTVTTYENIEIGKIAPAPKGYKPIYFTMVSRHGSRYELRDTTFSNPAEIYNRASKLGILTPLGEEVRATLNRAAAEQKGKGGELTALGQRQLRGIGARAYKNFKPIFDAGIVEGKSSTKMRCVFSMVAFVDGLKQKNPTIPVEIESRESHLPILRPMGDHPDTPQSVKDAWSWYAKNGGNWKYDRIAWANKQDISSMLSKVVTRPELLVEKCGAHNLFLFAYNTHHLLLFAQNLEVCDGEILRKVFTPEEQYICYLFHTISWLHWSGGWGNPFVECYSSYLRPLVEDVLDRAQAAIDGKNPHVANLRFTHDTYVVPLLSILGYEGLSLQYNDDWERGCCSVPFSTFLPMGANLQIVLYRNKRGEVLVRSLLNEKDVTLPIECDTAPFYPWSEFCKLAHSNLARLDRSQKEVLKTLK